MTLHEISALVEKWRIGGEMCKFSSEMRKDTDLNGKPTMHQNASNISLHVFHRLCL